MQETTTYDVLIVGGGIAGLSFALYLTEAKPDVRIAILNKGDLPENNTSLAQGGIAAVMDRQADSFESHIQDTLRAGQGRSNEKVVRLVVEEAPERILDLIRWGVDFDKGSEGYHLNREGGHAAHRILHHKDFTGLEIHRKLLQQVKQCQNVDIRTNCFAIDLTLTDGVVTGLTFYDTTSEKYVHASAGAVMFATGGSGQVFPFTTNSTCATGDGVAMAHRAGALIRDMQHYQFHPTALYLKDGAAPFLISEAVRGHGALVVNAQGRRFLFDHDTRGELATRDIVAGAILHEMKSTGQPCVFLSVKHLDLADFKTHFPTIWQRCEQAGLDLSKDDIPVVPAAHYQCGGIKVDEWGQTSLKKLYAGGECACTGLHGANRLASNSLLEALVFSYRSAGHILEQLTSNDHSAMSTVRPEWLTKTTPEAITTQISELQALMEVAWNQRFVPTTLDKLRLEIANRQTNLPVGGANFQRIYGEYRNLLDTAALIVDALIAEGLTQPQDIPV